MVCQGPVFLTWSFRHRGLNRSGTEYWTGEVPQTERTVGTEDWTVLSEGVLGCGIFGVRCWCGVLEVCAGWSGN